MKRSGIRVKLHKGLPDCAALHPGYTTVFINPAGWQKSGPV